MDKIVASIATLLISVVSIAAVYSVVRNYYSWIGASGANEVGSFDLYGAVKVEAGYLVRAGDLTELVLYIRSINAYGRIDRVYLVKPGGLLGAIGYPLNNISLSPGNVSIGVFALADSIEPGREYYVKLGLAGSGLIGAGSVILHYHEPAVNYTIYLVDVEGACSPYVGSIDTLRDALSSLGRVIIVRSQEEFGSIVRSAGSSDIIVNLHGEAVPAPAWVWSGAGRVDWAKWRWIGEPPKWAEWLSEIREAITVRGTVWVNVGGWPFYYLTNESCRGGGGLGFYQVAVHECGSDNWKKWVGYHGYRYIVAGRLDCVPPSSSEVFCYLSVGGIEFTATPLLEDLVPAVEQLTGYKPPLSHVHSVKPDRPCRFRGGSFTVSSLHEAEVSGTKWYGVYVARIGRGSIVHVGYGPSISEEERAALIVAGILEAIGAREMEG